MDWSKYRQPKGDAEIREFYDNPLYPEFLRLSSLYSSLGARLAAGADVLTRANYEEVKQQLGVINNRLMVDWHERRLRREAEAIRV